MACDCRRPINFYNDKTRYKTMIILYTFDLIFFIIRLSIVCHGISKGLPDQMPFLVPILIFDLFASVPIIISNLFYIFMRHCIERLRDDNRSLKCLWRFATMTYPRLRCHKHRPQAILLMRIIIIGCSFLLKFMCFVIGAACSARFKSECTAYTVIAAFALLVSIWIIMVEFINYFRLWRYNPTDTRNSTNNESYSAVVVDQFIEETHRGHLGFIHYELLNDQNSKEFGQSRCKQGLNCQWKSLHHYLFYHSLDADQLIDFNEVTEEEKRSFIAFYQTNKQKALNIAQYGFPYGNRGPPGSRDHLFLKKSIFFARSCRRNQSSAEAIICARLNLGRVICRNTDQNLCLNSYFAHNDGKCDTIYIKSTRRFYLRMPNQIEKWLITINKDIPVNDELDGTSYQPCI